MISSKCILQINLDTIKNNYLALCKQCAFAEVAAAVKSNAYGLGVNEVSLALKSSGCKHFFVSSCDEGIALRKLLGFDVNIYVLHGVFKEEIGDFLEFGLIPVLNHLPQIEIWQTQGSAINKQLPCIIHFDTGMNRLGMNKDELNILDLDIHTNRLNILYAMSHLISSEDITSESNQLQLEKFKQYSSKFCGSKLSLANSGGIFLGPDYHFDLVRSGAAIYGINPAPYLENAPVKSPVKLLAPIIQISDLHANHTAGYNATHTNDNDKSCKIATIPIGYGDGFFRSLSNKADVYINNIRAPIIGRISMDLTIIDVSNVPVDDLFLGQMAEVIGDNNTPDKIAKTCETNVYEIFTALGDRYKRVYS